eukprot:PITA_01401
MAGQSLCKCHVHKLQIRSTVFLILCYCIMLLYGHSEISEAAAVTDPKEVKALRIIASKMGETKWNFNVDPCSRDSSWYTLDDREGELGVICNCAFKKNTTCHVIKIKIRYEELSGIIPPELANLTYLSNIDLRYNLLHGSIPASMGSLTQMQYLSFGINKLSGEIPKEFGKLTNLITLSFDSNNLSGRIPAELGNLTNLEEFYIRSNRLTGEIPTTFANLKKMRVFWASSNNFTGNIPDFIGNWSQLEDLKLEGSSFEGPIPSSISNLTKLTSLIICDIPRGGSSLSFLQNLKNLTTLFLRNNMFSGQIPEYIGGLRKLEMLDLSFNNFTGQIPDSLRNVSSLKYLFLGSNQLTGQLPSWLSGSGKKVDLSYNNFSGEVPAWVFGQTLNVNLVGNFLEGNGANQRALICLQRSFPCYKGNPQSSSLAINCGGPQLIDSSTQVAFEGDNKTLDAASFYMNSEESWGVSTTGVFLNSSDSTNENGNPYMIEQGSVLGTTQDPSIYKTARLSPTSLRYYGLGLENGLYRVELHFEEIQIPATTSWRSLGLRIFDAYVQGDQVLKDFNIKEVAGDSNVPVVKNYTVNVTQNFLEVHFLWAGKGTCCVPSPQTHGPLVSAIRVIPEFKPTIVNRSSNNSGRTKIIGIVLGVLIGLGFVLCSSCMLLKRRKRRKDKSLTADDDEVLMGIPGRPNTFSLTEIQTATNGFDNDNKIGEGGFGTVYKGVLADGKFVAVKKLSSRSSQGKREFLNEVATISAVQHRNLVKLYGCCVGEEERILVYEYLENNSLGRALFGPDHSRLKLDWPVRYNICLEVARGLAYLHEESRIKIVHRDIKPNNILLDEHLNPKIADFGLAKLYEAEKTHISTRVAGTIGYLAPEYALRGHLTEKADVFSFGVVLLEVVSNRTHEDRSLPDEMVYLLDWTWLLYEENRLLDLVDTSMLLSYSEEEVLRIIHVGLLCTQASPSQRPSMSRVVSMISGGIATHPPQSRPGYIKDWQFSKENAKNENSRSWDMTLTLEERSQ